MHINQYQETSSLRIISPENNRASLDDFDSQQVEHIKNQYKEYGALLFRGFNIDVDQFRSFTDLFCHDYVSNKSPGRESASEDGRVQTVNLGERHFALHPEIAREPWQPEIAWFLCESPCTQGGQTNLCDGVEAVKSFPEPLFEHLRASALSHTLPTDLSWCAQYLNIPGLTVKQLLDPNLKSPFTFRLAAGQLTRTYVRPMLHTPKFSEELAYGNFLVFARKNLGIRNFPVYEDGSEIEDDLVNQIEEITNGLAISIDWQKSDLIMLDNTRFMHGRNPIGDPESRRILTQFGNLSFS